MSETSAVRASQLVVAPEHLGFGWEILRCEVGSTAHGTSVEAQDDLDMMGIVIPSKAKVLGLAPFDFHIYRTAAIREGRSDAKSQPGDIDLTLYSVRKFAALACKGNPSILMMFFAPILKLDPLGMRLRQSADLFHSKEAGYRFLGYMKAQRGRMAGDRGQKRVNRPELIEQYGYDTKYAYHLLRLGIQGLEFVRTGRITVPMQEWVADFLKAVRTGNYQLEQVLHWASELEQELQETIDASPIPDKAPIDPINELLIDLHLDAW